MPPFTILMLIFAGALLLYAGIMALTKDYDMLPIRARQSVKPKNKKKYAFQLSKVIALVAAAPALSGIVGIWTPLGAGIVFVVGLIVFLWIGTKIMKGVS